MGNYGVYKGKHFSVGKNITLCETPLQAWLKMTGRSKYSIAKEMGVDPKIVTVWVSGRGLPSLLNAFKIEKATKGGVPAVSWLGTELGRILWNNSGTDWERLVGQRRQALRDFKRRRRERDQGKKEQAEASGDSEG